MLSWTPDTQIILQKSPNTLCILTVGVILLKRDLSRVIRKPTFFICENKDADQLRGNCEADQRLCFRYTDSTIPLLAKSEISSKVAVQPGLCRTRFSHDVVHLDNTRCGYLE